MKTIIDGIERYERLKRQKYKAHFASLAEGQAPKALFLTCADSRVVPNLMSLSAPGELFVVRNVANLVPPASDDEHGDTSVSSAVWYALEVLGVRDVIVCGHSGCGGVKALLSAQPPASRPLRRWLSSARPALDRWRRHGPYDDSYAAHDQLSQVSTRHQLDNLATHDFVRERLERGDVNLHAWWFDIPEGRVLAYSERDGRYIPAIEALEALEVPQQNVA